jgi:hypothetical protein
MEAANAIRDASQNSALDAGTARMVTKAFGLRLGALEVDYTTRKVEFPVQAGSSGNGKPANILEALFRGDSGQAAGPSQTQEMDTAALDAASSHPDPLWRRGLTAYARTKDQLRRDAANATRAVLAVI